MSNASSAVPVLRHANHFFIGGEWVTPSSDATFHVVDSCSEEVFLEVAEANPADMSRAVTAAHDAFEHGPWPSLSHAERAEYLRAIADGLLARGSDLAQLWPREAGVLYAIAKDAGQDGSDIFNYYAGLADTFAFAEPATPTFGEFGLLVREPVGVVGAIIPWNSPMRLIAYKVAPALIAGCTVVLKSSPEAPAEAYVLAEVAESVGLPPGVLNVVTADRQASEQLVRDPRVDKITFTGSTAAGRQIGAICAERVARCTLELGGKSAAVVLDDVDIAKTARALSRQECILSGQACSSLTRVIVTNKRHDEMVDALADEFARVVVGDPFAAESQMGPLVSERQRAQVEHYIAKGKADGAILAAGGGRPRHLDRGYYIEPTVFGRRRQLIGDRPGGDLRPAFSASSARSTKNTPSSWPTTRSTDSTHPCSPTISSALPRSPAGCAPAQSVTTRSGPTSALPSVASSSPESAAREAPRGFSHSSRPRR